MFFEIIFPQMEKIFREVEEEILKESREEEDKRRSYQLTSKEMERLAAIPWEGKSDMSLQEIFEAVKELIEGKGDLEEVKVSVAKRENFIQRIRNLLELIVSTST